MEFEYNENWFNVSILSTIYNHNQAQYSVVTDNVNDLQKNQQL